MYEVSACLRSDTFRTESLRTGADDLSDQTIEMLVVGTRNVQAATADVVDSLVINEERTVRILNGAVGRENSVVGLDDGGRDAGSGIHGEFELALLAVVGREALEEKSSESRSCTTTKGVEDEETLEGGAVVCSQSAQSRMDTRASYQQHDECGQSRYRPSPCQWCSDHEHLPIISLDYACAIGPDAQLLAASSFPLINSSGWNSWR